MTLATFTGCSRSVRAFSQQNAVANQGDDYGLQIREDRFDSGTRLHDLADPALSLSTEFSTFTFWARSVLGRDSANPPRLSRLARERMKDDPL